MKKFENPVITEIQNLNIEPVYAASGVKTNFTHNCTPGGNGEIVVETNWCNHNSGSHSEIKIHIHNYGKHSGDNIHMHFHVGDFKLDQLTPGDGCLIANNICETGFDLSRVGRHFNPGDDIQFVMQLKCKKPNGGVGAVGETGKVMPCNVYCTNVMAN